MTGHDVSFGDFLADTTLATGEFAYFTWASRSDVRVWWLANTSGNDTLGTTNIRKGDLTVGFGKDGTMIGPEYAFCQVLGDFYGSNDVLIIKTAWGGKALASEFRPPSAVADRGGEVGLYYQAIIDQARQALDNLGTEFPDWSGQGYQIVGIGWHQGFNDKVNPDFSAEYKDNLPDLISDLRGGGGGIRQARPALRHRQQRHDGGAGGSLPLRRLLAGGTGPALGCRRGPARRDPIQRHPPLLGSGGGLPVGPGLPLEPERPQLLPDRPGPG